MQHRLHFRRQDRALGDIYNFVRIAFEIADRALDPVGVPACPRAVLKRLRTRDHRDLTGKFDLPDPLEAVADHLNLGLDLCLVSHLLKIAPAARSEMRARRVDSLRRRLYDLNDLGKRGPLLDL